MVAPNPLQKELSPGAGRWDAGLASVDTAAVLSGLCVYVGRKKKCTKQRGRGRRGRNVPARLLISGNCKGLPAVGVPLRVRIK